jgi:hypothetical protein
LPGLRWVRQLRVEARQLGPPIGVRARRAWITLARILRRPAAPGVPMRPRGLRGDASQPPLAACGDQRATARCLFAGSANSLYSPLAGVIGRGEDPFRSGEKLPRSLPPAGPAASLDPTCASAPACRASIADAQGSRRRSCQPGWPDQVAHRPCCRRSPIDRRRSQRWFARAEATGTVLNCGPKYSESSPRGAREGRRRARATSSCLIRSADDDDPIATGERAHRIAPRLVAASGRAGTAAVCPSSAGGSVVPSVIDQTAPSGASTSAFLHQVRGCRRAPAGPPCYTRVEVRLARASILVSGRSRTCGGPQLAGQPAPRRRRRSMRSGSCSVRKASRPRSSAARANHRRASSSRPEPTGTPRSPRSRSRLPVRPRRPSQRPVALDGQRVGVPTLARGSAPPLGYARLLGLALLSTGGQSRLERRQLAVEVPGLETCPADVVPKAAPPSLGRRLG